MNIVTGTYIDTRKFPMALGYVRCMIRAPVVLQRLGLTIVIPGLRQNSCNQCQCFMNGQWQIYNLQGTSTKKGDIRIAEFSTVSEHQFRRIYLETRCKTWQTATSPRSAGFSRQPECYATCLNQDAGNNIRRVRGGDGQEVPFITCAMLTVDKHIDGESLRPNAFVQSVLSLGLRITASLILIGYIIFWGSPICAISSLLTKVTSLLTIAWT